MNTPAEFTYTDYQPYDFANRRWMTVGVIVR